MGPIKIRLYLHIVHVNPRVRTQTTHFPLIACDAALAPSHPQNFLFQHPGPFLIQLSTKLPRVVVITGCQGASTIYMSSLEKARFS
jgi:hypothetical protein